MNNNYFLERSHCPACGSRQQAEIYSYPLTASPLREYLLDFYTPQGSINLALLGNAQFTLDECLECGLIYQRFIPNDELMRILYDVWLDPATDYESTEMAYPVQMYVAIAQEITTLIAYLDMRPSQLRFFDFGMGWGKWAIMAKAFGCQSYGHDLSQQRAAHAARHGVTLIDWDDIPNHQFDVISIDQVMEHVAEPAATLAHLKQALKPGELLKFSVPDGSDIKARLAINDWFAPKGSEASLNAVAPLEHINCFSFDVIVYMAEKADMEVVSIPQLQHNVRQPQPSQKRALRNLGGQAFAYLRPKM